MMKENLLENQPQKLNLLGKMRKRLKDIFKEEENKINQITEEINVIENIEIKSELAEVLLIVVNNALDKLDKNFKVHEEYNDYKRVLLMRKEAAESIIRTKGRNPLGAINAVFNALKRLIGK